MSEKSICLGLSGGMDSGTLLGLLRSEGYNKIYCLGFNYGSKHNKYEIEAAKKLAAYYEADYQLIEMPFINQLFKSNLLQSGEDIPEGHYNDETMSKTVVPGRNIIFASILAGYAWSKGCNKIALGVHFGDSTIYPDCRAEFIKALDTCLYLGTDHRVSVYAPFLEVTKKEILQIGLDIGVPYEHTRTCYKSQDKSCGACGSCRERLEAFDAHGIIDPIEYESSGEKYPEDVVFVLAVIKRTYSDQIKTDTEFIYRHNNQWVKALTDKPLEENAKVISWKYQDEIIKLIKGEL